MFSVGSLLIDDETNATEEKQKLMVCSRASREEKSTKASNTRRSEIEFDWLYGNLSFLMPSSDNHRNKVKK